MKRAVITIEVLIALVIIFSAIVLVTTAARSLNLFALKKERYQRTYVTALSLQEMLQNRSIPDTTTFTGMLNGFSYTIACRLAESRRNFVVDEFGREGNTGSTLLKLYKCRMQLVNEEGLSAEYNFYLSRFKNPEIVPETQSRDEFGHLRTQSRPKKPVKDEFAP